MRTKLLVSLLGILVVAPVAFGAASLPTWSVDDWYQVDLDVSAGGDMEGAAFTFALDVDPCQWVVDAIQNKTLPQCGLTDEVYVLGYSGCGVQGTGHITMTDPITFDADLRLTNGSADGQMWVFTADLNPAAFVISASANVEAYLFGSWAPIGTISITDLTLEFCPMLEDFQWPLDVGNNWNSSLTAYISGHYLADLEIFGIPYQLEDDLAENQDFAMSGGCTGMETMNGCNSYKVAMNNSGGQGTMNTYYCPTDILWYSRKEMVDFVFEDEMGTGAVTLNNLTWDILQAHHAAGPDPTPTPAPTPGPGEVTVGLTLNQTTFHPNDTFLLQLDVNNGTGAAFDADTYILLDVFGASYFAWPSWNDINIQLDFQMVTFAAGPNSREILTFTWPSGAGTADGLAFWAALFEPGHLDVAYLVGGIGNVTFGFAEP
ncbi:hypothetical protein JW905_03095 [bacterium]|nr:hypothetical protein [candidate division CSSED10-310 bacterium]